MTIKGLWIYYKKSVGYGEILISELEGKIIAIDIYGLMYATRVVSKGIYMGKINPFYDDISDEADEKIDKMWISHFFDTVIEYLRDGFLPIFVYDGPKTDMLKLNTLKKRSTQTENLSDRADKILKKYENTDLLAIPSSEIDNLRTLLKQINIMPKKSVDRFRDFFRDIGIPWVNSTGEGERTCALMSRDKIVNYIICDDGDILACGANVTILKEKCQVYDKKGSGDKGYITAHLDNLLDTLGMEYDLFQELCIMSGTDFNDNIKGVGLNKAAKLLTEHGCITKVGKNTKYDISVLNHREVRKRFAIIPWKETVVDYCLDLTFDEKKEAIAMAKYDLANQLSTLIRLKKKVAKKISERTNKIIGEKVDESSD